MTNAFRRSAVFRFRWLLYELVLRDVILRYRGSALGFAWTLLNPLLFMGVYTLVFSVFMRSAIPHYPLFLLSGLIPWMWFSAAVSQSVASLVNGRTYIGKTLMPAELLVLVPVLSNGVNFIITVALLFPVGLAFHVNVLWALLTLPLLTVIELCVATGFSLILAAANVFYRDLEQVVTYLLTAAFFLTPIFYARAAVPQNLQFVVEFNPMAGLISAYQDVFFRGAPPNPANVVSASVFAFMILVLGLAYFNSKRDSLGDEL